VVSSPRISIAPDLGLRTKDMYVLLLEDLVQSCARGGESAKGYY